MARVAFTYTVAAGQNVALNGDVAIASVSATVKDSAGHAVNFSTAVNADLHFHVDGTAPTIGPITSTPGNTSVVAGKAIVIDVNVSEAVTLGGNAPTLVMSDRGIATFDHMTGNTLEFKYTANTLDGPEKSIR